MSPPSNHKKLIVVIGATGTQGGNVVRGLLKHSNSEYLIRAITRDPNKPSAKSLTAQGVEVVKADIDNLDSLKNAFSGAYAIYAYTNFFDVPLISDEVWEKREFVEEQQGRNLALAAAATLSLVYYLWSSTPPGTEVHNKIRFFNSKSRVSAFIKAELPQLWEKTTEIWIGYMYENYMQLPFVGPVFTGDGLYQIWMNMKPSSVLGSVSCEDLGPFVHFLLQSGSKYHSKTIGFSAEELTESSRLATWGKLVNRRVQFNSLTTAENVARIHAFGVPASVAEGFSDLIAFFDRVGNVYSGEGVLQARDILPRGFLKSWEEYVLEHNWTGFLGGENAVPV